MVTTTDIHIENRTIRWNDNGETVNVDFAYIDSQEQATALLTNLDKNVEHWVWFDEQIFMYVDRYCGETIESVADGSDFTLEPVEENEND